MKLKKQYNRLVLGTLICVLKCSTLFGQQTASFPEYNFNPFIINPAYAGLFSQDGSYNCEYRFWVV